MPRPAVFLARDGVINCYVRNPKFGTMDVPVHPDDFELLPGVAETIASLNRLCVPAVVVSNQPGIAEGKLTPRLLDAITEKMRASLALAGARLDAVLYCRHHPDGIVGPYATDCECRKPKPAMLFRAARERNLSLRDSFFVGNSADDIAAGHAAGVTTFLISSHRCATCAEFASQEAHPDCVVTDLAEAVRAITQFLAAYGKLPASAAVPIPAPPTPPAGPSIQLPRHFTRLAGK
jgi:D-glycero-D-manno-heptose 1,7-bisphosphate phosphatase